MDNGLHRNGAGPSQNRPNVLQRALQSNLVANLIKTAPHPSALLNAKQSQWDRHERAKNRKFERREKQIEKQLARRAAPKPSLRIPRGAGDESGTDEEGRADYPDYENNGDGGLNTDGYSPGQIVAPDHDDQDMNDNGNDGEIEYLDPEETPENLEVSGLCDDENRSLVFDMTEFRDILRKCHEHAEIEESNKVILQKESDVLSKCLVLDADTRERLPNSPDWVAREHFENPFVSAIIASNYEKFFELYAFEMKRNGMCSEGCLCKLNLVSPPKIRMNPIHLAAVVSNVEFLENVVSDAVTFVEARREKIIKLLETRSERVDRRKSVEHYEEIIERWVKSKSHYDMIPVDLAAEYGRVGEYDALFRQSTENELFRDALYRSYKEKEDYKEPLLCYHVPSIASRLVHQKNFLKVHQKRPGFVLGCLFDSLNIHKKRYAVSMAARNGDMETLKFFQELQLDELYVFGQRDYCYYEDEALVVPGKILKDGGFAGYPVERSPVAHELVENGHFDAFNSLEVEQKLVRDFYGFTALVSLLEFSDEQVKSQLKLFETAEREDLFLFVSQVIVKNRRELLKDALQLVLMNPDNFDVKTKCNDIYRDYGLPDYVPLPMETALSRTGDMTLVEMIAETYQKFMDKHRRKMIEEDVLRCINSIQDRACRCSDQIRLAVICMMFPFVPPSSDRFKKMMKMYLDRGENDNVSKYVLKNYSVAWKTYKLEKWNVVFKNAGIEVKKWNGSVESEQILNNINPQGNKGLGKDIPFFFIRKAPRKDQSRQLENGTTTMTINRSMNDLVNVFRRLSLIK